MGAAWLREYRHRRLLPGLTHEQYLDEPLEVIEWMQQVHQVVTEQQRTQQQQ